MTALAHALPPADHNAPPSALDILRQNLAEIHADLLKRQQELHDGLARVPEKIGDDETAGKVADYIRLIAAAIKTAETARKSAKEPHIEAGKAVDGFFNAKVIDSLTVDKDALQSRLNLYLQAKAAERARAEREAAARAREEAERLAAQATTAAQFDTAIAAEQSAAEHQEKAEAKPAELARTRGDLGSVATLRTSWVFEIEDETKIPREFLMVNDAAIKARIKARPAGQAPIAVAGIKFVEKSSTFVR